MNKKIRIKLQSYDYNLVDKSAEKIVKTVKSTGAVVNGRGIFFSLVATAAIYFGVHPAQRIVR